ncbi:MAG: ABC transporter ATP-binding protein [Chloroflexi bacterium]|nr:ABC transporter ATP-binding protein [Chloroflexota bacterium]
MAYLELKNVHKNFGNVKAVDDFSLDVEKGSLVSFLGPSGCGKTTTLRMIAGFEQPDGGSIHLDDEDITRISPNQRDIGMVFQAYALFPNMTVRQNVAFGLKMKKAPKDEIEKRVNEVLNMVRLKDTAKRYPHQLSGGQQQRIALARALAVRPRVLLLDEPLSALDAEVRVALRGEIRRIQSELAITTVYVTHDQEEALSISDKVVVMENGIIQQVGTPQEIYRAPQTRFVATFIGTANQFFGKVSGKTNVSCETLNINCGKVGDLRDGEKVVVLVRPESIHVTRTVPEKNSGNTIEGIVETITFHGAVTRLGVNVKQQHVVADITVASNELISLNQKVWLSFKPDACKVMALDE